MEGNMLNFNVIEELSNFKQIDVENVESRIGAIPEDMKQAMELYNKALDDLQSKNEDIAVIALRKAISLYPEFYEAMNLMGICYLSMDEEHNARKMFNKVIQMENNSIRASNYLSILDGEEGHKEEGSSKRFKRRKAPSMATTWLRENLQNNQGKNFITRNLAGIIIGILLMCILWLIIPGTPINIDLSGVFSRGEDMSPQIEKLQNEKQDITDRLNDANEALVKANETENMLREELEQYTYWIGVLKDLQKLADNGEYMDVVLQIKKDLAGISKPNAIDRELKSLEAESKPKSISQFYESGRAIYRANKKHLKEAYIDATNDYIMAINIIEELGGEVPSNVNTANVYYYGAKAIALSEHPSKEEAESDAIRCFNQVIEISPHSDLAYYSQSRIHEIENGIKIKH